MVKLEALQVDDQGPGELLDTRALQRCHRSADMLTEVRICALHSLSLQKKVVEGEFSVCGKKDRLLRGECSLRSAYGRR
jgi:hypothetical protein